MSVWEELRQAAAKLRNVPACPDPATCGGCVDAEAIANWMEHVADNMDDENAYEETRPRADGTTYTVVVIDGDCHLGLSEEWTAALENARKINAVDMSTIGDGEQVAEPVVTEAAKSILDVLNGFGPDPVGAVDWAIRLPEVASADGPNAEGEYQVELLDFSVIQWIPGENRWAVAVSDDTESEVSR